MRRVLAGLLLTFGLVAGLHTDNRARAQGPRHAVLITLDGVSTEEMFGGLDAIALASTAKGRHRGHPRLQGLLGRHAGVAARRRSCRSCGTRCSATMARLPATARAAASSASPIAMRFSYPGYAEILTGAAARRRHRSNDNQRYPFPTVLEFLAWPVVAVLATVAVFGSWETFRLDRRARGRRRRRERRLRRVPEP